MVAKKLMKVLITGSTSTLGIALIRELDILNIEHIDITKEQANLENPTKFTKIIYEHKPTCIYHIGWYGSVTERESNEQFSINVPSTLEIFRTATEVKSNIVFIGSLAENDKYKSPYSIAKKACGEIGYMMAQRAGINFCHVKLSTLYGPYDNPNHLIPMVINKIINGENIALGSGEQIWDYIYTEDAANALIALMNKSGIYEVGTGIPTTVKNIVDTILEGFIKTYKVTYGISPYIGSGIRVADPRKLRNDTGWSPKYTIKTGIDKTINHYIENYG